MWFGTILYVHLLLKPAYAARGLPRGELLVGWGSIVVMAVTGTVLTAYRIPTWDALFHTRFGVLLTIKIAVFLVMTATAFIVTFIVGPRLSARHADVDPRKRDLTAAELSSFTGRDGAPAYFAYQGMIYDATGSTLWRKGSHMGKHQAGFDLTEMLKLAPHGEDTGPAAPRCRKARGGGGAREEAAAPEGVLLHDLPQPVPRGRRAAGHRHVALVVIARHLPFPRRHHKDSANPPGEGRAWAARFPRS